MVWKTPDGRGIHKRKHMSGRRAGRSLGLIMAVLALYAFRTICSSQALSREYEEAPEYLIKAAYLYKFLLFIEWPRDQDLAIEEDGKIIIGIIGEDPFGDFFDPIEGRVIKNMKGQIAIEQLGPFKQGMDLRECRMLFICSSEQERIKEIIDLTRGTSILTVGETEDFLEWGGMVRLVNIKGHIRWELNLNSIRNAGLNVSATLLQSAVRVIHLPEHRDDKQNPYQIIPLFLVR